MNLIQIAELANWLNTKVPQRGARSLTRLHLLLITDHKVEIGLRQLLKLTRAFGLHTYRTEKGEYMVSRKAKPADPGSVIAVPVDRRPRHSYRRTLNQWMRDRVKPGECYPTSVLYDEFRATYDVPGLSSMAIGRTLDDPEFKIIIKRRNGVSTRMVYRIEGDPQPSSPGGLGIAESAPG
jgi:hypothetical protein